MALKRRDIDGAELSGGEKALSDVREPLKGGKSKKWRDFSVYMRKHYSFYLMILPGFLVLLAFAYIPMFGITLAFKKYNPVLGIFGSKWIGLDNFKAVFADLSVMRYIGNTLMYGALNMLFCFPIPIMLAVLMNELTCKKFKSVFQTICYLPYFLSWSVVGLILYFLINGQNGAFNSLREMLGLPSINFYAKYADNYWPFIITVVAIWKTSGWNTITYLATLTGISSDLYEAADIDGANRWQQVWHITLAGIMPTICITFILSVSSIVKDNYEMMFALTGASSGEESAIARTTMVLGSWVYGMTLGGNGGPARFGIGSAAALMQSVIAVFLMFGANKLVTKLGNKGIF